MTTLHSVLQQVTVGTTPQVHMKGTLYEHCAHSRYSMLRPFPAEWVITLIRIFGGPISTFYALNGLSRRFAVLKPLASHPAFKTAAIALAFFAMPVLLNWSPTLHWYNNLLNQYIASNTTTTARPLVRTINMASVPNTELGGQCAGASLYFNHLYLNRVSPADAARYFVLGAPPEAVTLHSQFSSRIGDPYELYAANHPHVLTLVPSEDEVSLTNRRIVYQNVNNILSLGNGPHLMRFNLGRRPTDYHALSLIKISNKQMYVFDPAAGLFEFKGQDIPAQIHTFIMEAYDWIFRYHIACYNRKKLSTPDLNPSRFLNFRIMIIPCFERLATSANTFDPQHTTDGLLERPSSTIDLFRYYFEEAVDTVKSWT